MRHGKSGRLLRKSQREFPDRNDSGVNEDGKSAVLKFAGEIAADPRIGTEQRQMAFRPTARDIGENRQNRDLVIVVPKKKRIVPEENKAE